MKTFGLMVPPSKGGKFEAHVRRLLADHDGLEAMILPVHEAWRGVRIRAADLGRQLLAGARRSLPASDDDPRRRCGQIRAVQEPWRLQELACVKEQNCDGGIGAQRLQATEFAA